MARWIPATSFLLASAMSQGAAQPAKTVSLSWSGLTVVISPNVGGVFVWARSGENDARRRTFSDDFDPAETNDWIPDARGFLSRELSAIDTGVSRISPVLHGIDGGSVYLARRKDGKTWERDPIVVFLSDEPKAKPVLVQMPSKSVVALLDSLGLVARGSSAPRSQKLRDSTGAVISQDSPAYFRQGTQPPDYPEAERQAKVTGMVLLQFVVGADGGVDLPTIQILHSTGQPFLESTLQAMTRYRFNPAMLNGKPIRQIIVMPFEFGLGR